KSKLDSTQDQLQKIAEFNSAKAANYCAEKGGEDYQGCLAGSNEQKRAVEINKALNEEKSILDPSKNTNNPCPPGTTATGDKCVQTSDGKTPPNGPPNNQQYRPGPTYTGGQYTPMGGQQLPMSPFGGSCTTGYVCQGNTLYYQSTNSYGM